ncbi:hypothetical protein BIS06_12830, partial [Halomonas sp. BBD48]|nr:hypothetical protein [Halomonas sp. BBD48]
SRTTQFFNEFRSDSAKLLTPLTDNPQAQSAAMRVVANDRPGIFRPYRIDTLNMTGGTND